jgi:hypothetical protein
MHYNGMVDATMSSGHLLIGIQLPTAQSHRSSLRRTDNVKVSTFCHFNVGIAIHLLVFPIKASSRTQPRNRSSTRLRYTKQSFLSQRAMYFSSSISTGIDRYCKAAFVLPPRKRWSRGQSSWSSPQRCFGLGYRECSHQRVRDSPQTRVPKHVGEI